ncbi:uncharacterized protein [Ptychodera flava]|uniref:uncharacterized protein n=1 Tax=Ptychodera flava TaxID=63121 RepID=UPI00396AA156
MPTIRASISTTNLHQINETSCRYIEAYGYQVDHYLDDILLMNQSKDQLIRDRDTLLFLLQHLGFGINWEKSYLVPTQEIEFLGFLINSVTMRMFLPESKILQIINQCANLAHKTLVSVRELAQIIGRMTASVAAIIPAPLQCRYLQMTRTRSLIHNKSYETLVTLSPECKTELQWWCHHLRDFNGKAIICPCPDLMITSDASKKRVGGTLPGNSDRRSVDSRGSHDAYQCTGTSSCLPRSENLYKGQTKFDGASKNRQSDSSSLHQQNGRDEIHSTGDTSKEMWNYCLTNTITIIAEHIPGVQNVLADWESRNVEDSSSWRLDPMIFKQIQKMWGPLNVDLFASRLNYQIDRYIFGNQTQKQ